MARGANRDGCRPAGSQRCAAVANPDPERSRHAGFDSSYFGAIERGEYVWLDTLVKIAAGLDTKASTLCARARDMTLAPARASEGPQNGPQTAILRSVGGPNPPGWFS